MTHPTPNLAPPDSPPDWSAHPDPVPCPLCTYDLRNLPTPRCPECGYSFTWPALLEARRTTHPYLFEHHPERNTRSFLRTSLASCLPRRFWRSLNAAHAIRPRRLFLYWLLSCLPLITLLLATLALDTHLHHEQPAFYARQFLLTYQSIRPGSPYYQFKQDIIAQYGSLQNYVTQCYPPVPYASCLANAWNEYGPAATVCALWLCWPFATAATLLAYRRSMRHAAIRPAHVARCTLYSADLLFWPALALLAYLAWTWGSSAWRNYTTSAPLLGPWRPAPRSLFPSAFFAWHAAVLLASYRLTVAYARYLRFHGAWLAVPLAATASLLLLWVLYLATAGPNAISQLPIWK